VHPRRSSTVVGGVLGSLEGSAAVGQLPSATVDYVQVAPTAAVELDVDTRSTTAGGATGRQPAHPRVMTALLNGR
jgi:hypothetical protein